MVECTGSEAPHGSDRRGRARVHGPLGTGRPEVSRPEQRGRVYAGFDELRRRLADARPDVVVAFVNDHLQNLAGYELSPAERTALKDGDITGLYHLGAESVPGRRVFRAR